MTQTKLIVIGICSVLALAFALNCYHIVPYGHRGVQVFWGTMNMEPLDEGFQFVHPLSTVEDVSIQNRKVQQMHTAETINTQTIQLGIAVNMRPNPKQIAHLIKEHTKNWDSVVVTSLIDDAVKAEIGLHQVADLVKNRPLIKSNLSDSIKTRLAQYYIDVQEVNVTELDFSAEYDRAIESKQVAEQEAQKMVNVLTKTRTEAEMAKAKAEGEANAKIEEARGQSESAKLAAQGKADALRIEGQAQQEYNEKVAKSLTLELIQRLYLEKWDGKLPVYTLGSDANLLVGLPQR